VEARLSELERSRDIDDAIGVAAVLAVDAYRGAS
jgi:hypothetical protein